MLDSISITCPERAETQREYGSESGDLETRQVSDSRLSSPTPSVSQTILLRHHLPPQLFASLGQVFNSLINSLVKLGYREKEDLVAAPYDWRRAPRESNY